jgi:hypothetical protein
VFLRAGCSDYRKLAIITGNRWRDFLSMNQHKKAIIKYFVNIVNFANLDIAGIIKAAAFNNYRWECLNMVNQNQDELSIYGIEGNFLPF